MFKKFDFKEDVSGQNQLKSSVQRGIRSKIISRYPSMEAELDDILPKKSPLILVKGRDHTSMISVDGEILFFNSFDGPWFPTLQLLHSYPNMMPRLQVDRGAIKFVLSGAHIMCPGLTSPGARMDVDLEPDAIVAIMAEGKEHALAIGQLKMSTADIRSINKGIGVDNIHYLNDCLWKHPRISE